MPDEGRLSFQGAVLKVRVLEFIVGHNEGSVIK